MGAEHVGFWEGIARNLGGKGQLRLIVQPLVAIVLGARLGISDAREGAKPFLLRLVLHTHRGWLKTAFSDVVVPFAVAFVVDGILQYYTLGTVRPGAAVIVAGLLVWLPFSIARALANRITRRWHHTGEAPA